MVEIRGSQFFIEDSIRRLEQEAGTTLLRRSTRRVALTEAGAAFYEGCAAMVAAARAARERLSAVLDSPRGELSVAAPAGFAAAHLVPALTPLLRAQPALRVRVIVTDEKVDLVQERIDLAITISRPLSSSSLVRHHLADWELGLVAAPAYLARHGAPEEPGDLAGHDFVTLPRWHHGIDVLTGPDGRRYRVAAAPRFTSNNQLLIKQLTLAGHGLSFQALPEVAADLAAGQLVRVLRSWSLPGLSVDALVPARRQPVRVRSAIQALKDYLAVIGRGVRRRRTRA